MNPLELVGHCARCGRKGPSQDDRRAGVFQWKTLGSGDVVCQDCITPQEQQAADEDRAGKVRENRLRRMADRQGLQLQKSRRRDPRALDYGTYMLVGADTNGVVSSGLQSGYGLTLDDVEAELTQSGRRSSGVDG